MHRPLMLKPNSIISLQNYRVFSWNKDFCTNLLRLILLILHLREVIHAKFYAITSNFGLYLNYTSYL